MARLITIGQDLRVITTRSPGCGYIDDAGGSFGIDYPIVSAVDGRRRVAGCRGKWRRGDSASSGAALWGPGSVARRFDLPLRQ